MAGNLDKWPSKRGPISKIRSRKQCISARRAVRNHSKILSGLRGAKRDVGTSGERRPKLPWEPGGPTYPAAARAFSPPAAQAGSWDRKRRVVAKVEWHPDELYPRVGFIVTNLSRAVTVSPLQPSDGMILAIGPRLEGHSVTFLAIQTYFSRYFHRAVDFLGLRRGGSWA